MAQTAEQKRLQVGLTAGAQTWKSSDTVSVSDRKITGEGYAVDRSAADSDR